MVENKSPKTSIIPLTLYVFSSFPTLIENSVPGSELTASNKLNSDSIPSCLYLDPILLEPPLIVFVASSTASSTAETVSLAPSLTSSFNFLAIPSVNVSNNSLTSGLLTSSIESSIVSSSRSNTQGLIKTLYHA